MPSTTANLILVRHGHVEGITPARFRGRAELPLTALGQRQAAALRDRITHQWTPDAIFTSPLLRCVHTAEAIAQPLGLSATAVPELNDLDYGAWQGLTDAEVHAQWPEEWARWHHTPQLAEFPEGENLRKLAKRAVNALHDILHAHSGMTVVIVAHDSVNRVLLLHALDLPLSNYRAITQAPCGLNVLRFEKGRFAIHTINEAGYLIGC